MPSIWVPPDYRSTYTIDPDTGAGVFGGGMTRNPSGVKVNADTALRATVYLACVRVLCETMASLPLYLYRRTKKGKEHAHEHPYYRLFLRRPNRWQTAWEWKQLMMLHLCTHGEAFNEKIVDGDLVTELHPLAPSRMRDVSLTDAGTVRYMFADDAGRPVPYGQDQINHFRWLTDDGLRGLVPVELAEDAIGLARACEIHGAAFFGNGARPGLVLKTPHETIDQLTRDEIRFTWMQQHGGPRKAHRPAVLTGGLEPAIVDGNNQESQFLETRRFQAEELCRVLGVPPHMVGILDRATFSNIEQQGIGYYQQTVLGWAERFEAALTRDVLGEEMADEYELAFDVSRILRGDAAARMAYYHTGIVDGIFSINEVRELEGLNSVDGGDQRFVGLNMQTLQQAAAASAAAAMPQPVATPVPDAVAGEPPAAEATPATVDAAPQVADVSLNGAQINGVIAILSQVSTGLLTPEAAKALVEAAFPSIPVATIDRVLAGTSTRPIEQEPASAPQPEQASETRAKPGTVAEGDFVSWGSSGGRARGRVDRVMTDGNLDVPKTDFTIAASEEDPAVLITVWEKVSGGWRATETQVGHKVSTLTKIDALPEPPSAKQAFKPSERRLPVGAPDARAFCATGTGGGIDPTCPSGDGGDSGGSSGSGIAVPAKAGDGPLMKAARDEHKRALDKLRKNIETAEAKSAAKFQKAADEYFKAKDAHYDVAERAGKLQEEHANLGQRLGADPTNEALKSQFAEASRLMEQSFSEMEASEKTMQKADAKREKARQEMRNATAIALRKECDAVNKEDGIDGKYRDRVTEMMSSPDRVASASHLAMYSAEPEQSHSKSKEIASRPVVAQEVKAANDYALRAINPEIHGQAMTTPLFFEDSVRANARVKEAWDHGEEKTVGSLSSLQTRGSLTTLAASDNASTHLHEMAHHIEYSTPEVRQLTTDFLQSRTRGEQDVLFAEKFASHGYDADERGSPDDFKKAFVAVGYSDERAEARAHYTGKKYSSGSTEVLTMGIELMYKDAAAFAKADPEWFDLVSGVMSGRILTRTRRARKNQVQFKDA